MQRSILDFRFEPFLFASSQTHVSSFVAQFVYVQIGSHDGVVAGRGYIIGGEAPARPNHPRRHNQGLIILGYPSNQCEYISSMSHDSRLCLI